MADKNREFVLIGAGSTKAQEKIEKPALSFLQDAWRRLKKNKLAVVSLWFLTLLISFSLVSPLFVSQKDANSFDSDKVSTYSNLPPNSGLGIPGWNGVFQMPGSSKASNVYEDQAVPKGKTFLLGTDSLGRSLGKRIIVGVRISLLVAVAATCIDLLIGVVYGLTSGYVGGAVDIIMQLLPNISGVIIVQIMMTIPSAIMYEAILSAINLGVKPPTSSLGSLISDAQENLQYYPYQIILPALALVFISLAFILLGDGLRDAFDPKSGQD